MSDNRDDEEGEAWGAADSFLAAALVRPDAGLEAALASSAAAGLPPIQASPLQGQLLGFLVRSVQATRVLEVGTLGGYSTIQLARAVAPGGNVLSVEFDADRADVARRNVEHAGLGDVVTIECGSGVEVVQRLVDEGQGPFDVFHLDVDRSVNESLLPLAIELSRVGSIIVIGAKDLLRDTRGIARVIQDRPELTATAIQAVGSNGFHGHVIAHVGPT